MGRLHGYRVSLNRSQSYVALEHALAKVRVLSENVNRKAREDATSRGCMHDRHEAIHCTRSEIRDVEKDRGRQFFAPFSDIDSCSAASVFLFRPSCAVIWTLLRYIVDNLTSLSPSLANHVHHHGNIQRTPPQDQLPACRHRAAVRARRRCAHLNHVPFSQALQPRIERLRPPNGYDVRAWFL